MGCRTACSTSTTLLMVILGIVFVLTTLNQPVAHPRHVRSPSMSTGEHSSVDQKGLRGTSNDNGMEHTKKTETVSVEKGPTAGGAAGASFGRRGGSSSSPAASAEKVFVVVVRDGPRPHPKKHN